MDTQTQFQLLKRAFESTTKRTVAISLVVGIATCFFNPSTSLATAVCEAGVAGGVCLKSIDGKLEHCDTEGHTMLCPWHGDQRSPGMLVVLNTRSTGQRHLAKDIAAALPEKLSLTGPSGQVLSLSRHSHTDRHEMSDIPWTEVVYDSTKNKHVTMRLLMTGHIAIGEAPGIDTGKRYPFVSYAAFFTVPGVATQYQEPIDGIISTLRLSSQTPLGDQPPEFPETDARIPQPEFFEKMPAAFWSWLDHVH